MNSKVYTESEMLFLKNPSLEEVVTSGDQELIELYLTCEIENDQYEDDNLIIEHIGLIEDENIRIDICNKVVSIAFNKSEECLENVVRTLVRLSMPVACVIYSLKLDHRWYKVVPIDNISLYTIVECGDEIKNITILEQHYNRNDIQSAIDLIVWNDEQKEQLKELGYNP